MNNYLNLILNNNLYTTIAFSTLYIILLYCYNKYNKIKENLHNYVRSFLLVSIVIFLVIYLKSRKLELYSKNINIEEPKF